MSDLFERELLECQWRDIGVPVTSIQVQISHDLALHKRPDQDGARVEATGRNPLVFSATIPFRNNLAPGPSETWRVLYPDTWHRFLQAMADRSPGTLQHPSLGRVVCRPLSATSVLSAALRDGEDAQAEWIEDSLDEDASNAILSGDSPIGSAVLEAMDLDARLAASPLKRADPDAARLSFEDALRQATAAVDSVALLSKKPLATVGRILYRLDALERSLREAQDPQNWPLKDAILRVRSALERAGRQASASERDVKLYIVPGPTTLGTLSTKLLTPVRDLIRLNPALVKSVRIEAMTQVRYYARAT